MASEPLLRLLITVLEDEEDYPGPWVTLTLPGMLVSGRLISSARYANRLVELWMGDSSDTRTAAELQMMAVGDAEPRFVHLERATFFLSHHPIPERNGLLWRVELSSVLAMSLGYLGVMPAPGYIDPPAR